MVKFRQAKKKLGLTECYRKLQKYDELWRERAGIDKSLAKAAKRVEVNGFDENEINALLTLAKSKLQLEQQMLAIAYELRISPLIQDEQKAIQSSQEVLHRLQEAQVALAQEYQLAKERLGAAEFDRKLQTHEELRREETGITQLFAEAARGAEANGLDGNEINALISLVERMQQREQQMLLIACELRISELIQSDQKAIQSSQRLLHKFQVLQRNIANELETEIAAAALGKLPQRAGGAAPKKIPKKMEEKGPACLFPFNCLPMHQQGQPQQGGVVHLPQIQPQLPILRMCNSVDNNWD